MALAGYWVEGEGREGGEWHWGVKREWWHSQGWRWGEGEGRKRACVCGR